MSFPSLSSGRSPSLSLFGFFRRNPGSPKAPLAPVAGGGELDDDQTFLSTLPAGPRQRYLALAVVVASVLIFLCVVPYVRVPLAKMAAFIPTYESALAINELITAILLFGQATRLRSRALVVLGAGYLFNTLLIIPHALTFPGVFSPTGLLGAGSQSTAWLYVFWHGGFPLFVLGYAFLRNQAPAEEPRDISRSILAAVALVSVAALALTLLSTWGMELLPVLIQGGDFSLLISTGTSPTVWVLSLIALIVLFRQRPLTILDLWLAVVMCAWLLDVAMSAIISSARYDLGWYAGRIYGLLAASFVLGVLLLETNGIHARLAAAKTLLAGRARDLERRVLERTEELQRSNEALKSEISVREKAQQELMQTRSFLDVIIESLPAMLLVKDAKDGKCILLNRAGEDIIGCGRAEVIGKTVHDVMPKHEADIIEKDDKQALASDKPYEIHENTFNSRDRGPRLLRTKILPVRNENGDPKYLLSFSEDVTDQRQTEDQLRHAQKMEALGQLTGGLAHDFNNLLAIIIGNLDVLSESQDIDSEKKELIQSAIGAAVSGSELTRRLLAFARRQPLLPEHVDLNELIADISKLLSRTLGETIEIKLDLSPEIPKIAVDRVQLETALANLANNARDAMPKGGRLVFTTRTRYLDEDYAALHAEVEPGPYVVIEVSDSGEGMSPEVQERIFEPFYTTKDLGKGTGLGLSMVFGFMKQSGGHINVYSEPGRGTTFRLYLRPASLGAAPSVKAPPLQMNYERDETILVVEDNIKLREVVVRQLKSFGFRVLEVDSAQAALHLLESYGSVDLIFSDVVLPGEMDGCALAREVISRTPDAKILLTSGFPGTSLAGIEGLGNAARLLSKPYRKEELAERVREALDS